MSNEVITLVYRRNVGCGVRKAILLYFADRASDGGEGVWASKGTVADAIEWGRSTVFRKIGEMVEEGILIPVGKRACTNGETVEYDMDLDKILAMPVIEKTEYVPRHKLLARASGNQSRSGTGPATGPHQSQSGTPPVPQRDPNPPLTLNEPTSAGAHASQPEAEQQQVSKSGFSDGFWTDLLQALGIIASAPGKWWEGDQAKLHVARWLEAGLTEAQILTVARKSREAHTAPPDGPKGLDKAMKAEAAKGQFVQGSQTGPIDVLKFWAQKLNAGAFVATSAITVTQASELIRLKLVEPEVLRVRGIAFTPAGA